MNDGVVYWIRCHEHTDKNTEGYIGITTNLVNRLGKHRDTPKNQHLARAITKYGWDNLVKEVIYEDSYEGCALYEYLLRPTHQVGWNITAGGSGGFNPASMTEEARRKRARPGATNHRARKVRTPDGVFACGVDAAEFYNICPKKAQSRARRENMGWSYEN